MSGESLRRLRPTLWELLAGAALCAVSLLELFDSSATADEHSAQRVLVPVVVCLSLGWLRCAPVLVVALWSLTFTWEGLAGRPTELLGLGFASMAIAFGVAAFGERREWPVAGALLAVGWLVRDLGSPFVAEADAIVDLVLCAAAFGVGLLVHARTARAVALQDRVQEEHARAATAGREAVAAERARLARELHDIVAHAVSVMVVQAGTSRPLAQRIDDRLDETLARIEETGREALTELRRLLHVLRTDEGHADTVPTPDEAQLPALVERTRAAGFDVRLVEEGMDKPLDAGLGLAVYRVVQEGLTNAVRHGGGTTTVRLHREQTRVSVTVDSQGNHEGPRTTGSGTGLVGLRERVALFGGTLTAGPFGEGFRLSVVLPLAGAPEAGAGVATQEVAT